MIYQRQSEASPGASPPATQPPSNSGGVPKLGGSSAGFIVLVVGLAAIVVICCAATFFLLRGHKVDPFEQHARRVLAGKREATVYEMPLGPQGIRQKFKHFFTFGRKRDGWMRANSGDADEWDASDRLVYDHPRDDDHDTRWTSGSGMYDAPPSRAREDRGRPGRSETSDSIELTVPPLSPPPSIIGPSVMGGLPSHLPQVAEVEYINPFAAEPGVASADELRQGESVSEHDDNRFRVPSGESSKDLPTLRSMRKFESGTKFREALEF